MHFNRTQFAGKRHMRLFSLTTLILIFLLSSCIDADFNALANISLPRYWVGSPISSPRFTEDSIVYDSMPVYKVCSSVRFDPTTVLTAFPIHYRETNGQNKPLELRQDLIDTIDFKVHGPYVHKARITKITGNTEYHVSGVASSLSGKDYIAGSIAWNFISECLRPSNRAVPRSY
jgi:hypothetical protein